MIFYDQKLSFSIAAIYINDSIANNTHSAMALNRADDERGEEKSEVQLRSKIWMTYE